MLVLHSSDWHLGQQFFSHSRLSEQRRFLAWLRIVIASLNPGAFILAGDIFDSARPSYEAQTLWADFLAFCAQNHTHLIACAGNHDSPECLEINKNLAELSEYVHIIASSAQIIDLGSIIIAAAPFLTPEYLKDLSDIDGFSTRFFTQLAARAKEQNPAAFCIGVGHLAADIKGIVPKGQEGEKEIYIGHSACVSAKNLDMFDYFALGHIHQASGTNPRYSGAPLPISYAENPAKSLSAIYIDEPASDFARQIHPRAQLACINIPRFSQLIKLSAKSAADIDLAAFCEGAYLHIELEQLSAAQAAELAISAKEHNLRLTTLKQASTNFPKTQQNSEICLEQLSPELVLKTAFGVEDQALLDELKRTEQAAQLRLANEALE